MGVCTQPGDNLFREDESPTDCFLFVDCAHLLVQSVQMFRKKKRFRVINLRHLLSRTDPDSRSFAIFILLFYDLNAFQIDEPIRLMMMV
jgi:hypothetical protein